MPTILGVNFGRAFWGVGGGAATLEEQGRNIRGKVLAWKFAEKFAGNLPKIRRSKSHPKSALQSLATTVPQ